MMRHHFILILCAALFFACNNSSTSETGGNALDPQNLEESLQERLINAKDGDVIELPEGTFSFKRQISFNDVPNVTIKGAGKKKTILSFKEQVDGAEGLIVKGANGITLEGFAVMDAKGDAIKVQECENVIMRDLEVIWTGGKLPTNGAYGLYPVNCTNVLMEDCEASYAMDAGVYVGQSTNVVVRNNYAHNNVAGIEVENTIKADVYGNNVENNTGGLLIFDMPDLPQANGSKIKVHDNNVAYNNSENFSAEGIVVNILPPGTGMLLMAHTEMEVYNNVIKGHCAIGLGITSWMFTGREFKSEEYDPFCSAISVYENVFETCSEPIDTTTDFGKLFSILFQETPKDIVTDNLFNPAHFDEKGQMMDEHKICIRDNGEVTFVNLHAEKGASPEEMAKNMDTDITPFDCEGVAIDISGHDAWLQ